MAPPFGQDALRQFHRQIGCAGLAFVAVHVVISARWEALMFRNAIEAPALVWFGMAAALALLVLVVTSVWRLRLRLSYEGWHAAHTALAVVAVAGALGHMYLVDEYVSTVRKQALWGLMSGAFVALLVWVRLLKPRRMRERPPLRAIDAIITEAQGRS